MEKLRQDIKGKTFESVYLLFGEETYLVRSYKEQLKQAISGEDTMNFSYFEGKGVSLEAVSDLAMTMPFFAERRLILLDGTGLFKGTVQDGWIDLVKLLPETCHLVFVESEVDKRNRLYKAVGSCGYCGELQRQSDRDLKRWIVSGLSRQNLGITSDALELFLQKTGDDMENIRMEMEKLASYCMGCEGVTSADVEAICTERITNRIFEMTQAVSEGNQTKALELYYDLLALKEPGMRILFLIARQMNQLLCVKEMMAGGGTKDSIASNMKLRPFIAGKLMTQARRFSVKQLRSCVELCVSLEEAVKSGNMNDQIAVEMVLMSISSGRAMEQ
ncbi:MAG: DNA polymerase III subunit delta [Lachnospiraceae bacterium]|nr:DNA polymerase III subunit delta [Lachnospiraceae bacterium]